MKNIVYYYSRKSSNKYLAQKIANSLSCNMEEIRPRLNAFIFFMLNINGGIRKVQHSPADYDRVILVGPVFMGRFIPPLRSFLNRYNKYISKLIFVTCCGSTYDKKDEKFGHGIVFEKVRSIMDDRLVTTQAFPVGLVLPEGQKEDPEAFMKAHLNDSTFKGEIEEIYDDFIKRIKV